MKYDRLVTFAIPTVGKIDPKFMINMLIVIDQLATGSSWRVRITDQDRTTGKVLDVATARETLVKEVLKEDNSKYIMFVDSDVFLPPRGFAYLQQSKKPMITGVYWTKSEPPEPVIYQDLHMGPYLDFPKRSLFELDAAGMGCCLIDTEVFRKIPKPWFDYKIEKDQELLKVGEDFFFFIKAKKYGYPLWCNSNVLCTHLKEEIPQKFYPNGKPEISP
jgi:hypothetical protein|tara:strand:- start:1350 stop:2003 length:654 start_codon:yes stop_codon:yes gene_type:complete